MKAAYSFFDRADVTPAEIQAPHQRIVREELQQAGTSLLIEDSSEFTWDDEVPRRGLGRINPYKQGFILHSSLAVTWEKPKGAQGRREALTVIGLVCFIKSITPAFHDPLVKAIVRVKHVSNVQGKVSSGSAVPRRLAQFL